MIYLVPKRKMFKQSDTVRQHIMVDGRRSKCGMVFTSDERYTQKKKEHDDISVCRKCVAMVNGRWRLHGYEYV